MSQRAILARLKHGPATNAELQEAACDHSGGIARTMAKLIRAGKAARIDSGRGRGSIALYAFRERQEHED